MCFNESPRKTSNVPLSDLPPPRPVRPGSSVVNPRRTGTSTVSTRKIHMPRFNVSDYFVAFVAFNANSIHGSLRSIGGTISLLQAHLPQSTHRSRFGLQSLITKQGGMPALDILMRFDPLQRASSEVAKAACI